MNHKNRHSMGKFVAISILTTLLPLTAIAAESASFRLYPAIPGESDTGPQTSGSFSLNENGSTWIKLPLVSTSFQLVTAPPTPSASSVSSAASSSSAATITAKGGGRGSRRQGGGPPRHAAPDEPTQDQATRDRERSAAPSVDTEQPEGIPLPAFIAPLLGDQVQDLPSLFETQRPSPEPETREALMARPRQDQAEPYVRLAAPRQWQPSEQIAPVWLPNREALPLLRSDGPTAFSILTFLTTLIILALGIAFRRLLRK